MQAEIQDDQWECEGLVSNTEDSNAAVWYCPSGIVRAVHFNYPPLIQLKCRLGWRISMPILNRSGARQETHGHNARHQDQCNQRCGTVRCMTEAEDS